MGVEMYNHLLRNFFVFFSIAIFLTSPVFHRDSTQYLARYFSHLDFYEVDKFNLLTSNGCISVAIVEDIFAERDKMTERNKSLIFLD